MKILGLTTALAALAVAASTTVFSGAFLNSSDMTRQSSAGTGEVAIDLEHMTEGDGQSGALRDVIRAEALRPGEATPRTGTVRLTNQGSLPVDLSIDPAATASGPLAAVLRLQVDDCGASAACASPDTVYDGTLAAAPRVELSAPLATGAERIVRLRLSWPLAAADPALYGASIEPTFKWIARSVSGP